MTRFIMTFRGQCSFVVPSDGKEAWVLMRNIRAPEKRLHGHRALIEVSSKFVECPADRVPPRSSVILVLDRDVVDIRPGGRPLEGDLRIKDFPPTGNPDLTDPDSVSEDSFLWVAPLELACRGAGIDESGGYADESLLSGPLSEDIATRIHLNGGHLGVSSRATVVVGKEAKRRFVIWRFRRAVGGRKHKGHRQILASEVAFTTKFEEDFLDLVFTTHNGRPEKLRLRPRRGIIEVSAFNEEGDQILGVGSPEDIKVNIVRKQDRIFESYYAMSKLSKLQNGPIPVAVKFVGEADDDGGAHNAPPCSPSQMALVLE
jgi:hypothetical protein